MVDRPSHSTRNAYRPSINLTVLAAFCTAVLTLSACVTADGGIITAEPPVATPYQVPSNPTVVLETPLPTFPPTATPTYVAYVILEGENLTTIATKFNLSVDDLMRINGINDPNTVFVGQQLAIPSSASSVMAGNCQLQTSFVNDVTVPDNTIMQPGEIFVKTWRIMNAGTCDWNEDYRLVLLKDGNIGAPPFITIPHTPPGEAVDISIPMVAPKQSGIFTSIWSFQASDGTNFGAVLYVRIVIPGSQAYVPQPASGLPVISGITKNARNIFLKGQELGNRPNVFSKIGDSITYDSNFLGPIGNGRTLWYGYEHLAPASRYFMQVKARTGNSFNNDTLAAFPGWEAIDLTDSSKALSGCLGHAPLDCELMQTKPSVAIIMIGTNDSTGHEDLAWFQGYIDLIIEKCIEAGVIPVMSTVPWNAYEDIAPYNAAIIESARAHDVPVLDTYGAFETLPNHGVGEDGVHPTVPPNGNTADFSSSGLNYGYNMRNLITLQMLDAIWRQVLSY